jgi:hypothetical protein
MLRTAIDVGAQIEHVRVAGKRRQDGADRRPVDAGQHFQDKAGNRHQRTGIAGRNTGIRLALLDQIDRDPHRRVFLVAQRQGRRLVHGDHFAGMANEHPADRRIAEKGPNAFGKTDQDHPHVGVPASELQGSRNGHLGAVVPAHAIDGNGNGHSRRPIKEKAGSSPSCEAARPIQWNYSPEPLATFLPR